MCRCEKTGLGNRSSVFPTWSDTNQAVQPKNMARGLKFRIYRKKRYCTIYVAKKKGADQLRGYREADHLRLCFRICKKPVFSRCGSYVTGVS